MEALLGPQDIKALEQTRQRLSQLTNSLASLQRAITVTDPLPPWYTDMIISSNISTNCLNIQDITSIPSYDYISAPYLRISTSQYPP